MTILCGVDDSGPAREAARVAVALARRTEQEVELVYVQDALILNAGGPDAVVAPRVAEELLEADRKRVLDVLGPLRDELARDSGVRIGLSVTTGMPDRELLERADRLNAALIVVGAVGRRRGSAWRLGSVADRLSQSSPVPVLVVREAQSFVRWAARERPLRVVLALSAGPSSQRAAEVAGELARLGGCEVLEAHAYDLRHEVQRLGLEDAGEEEARVTIERTLARELPERAAAAGLEGARFVAVRSDGHPAAALTELCASEHADLVVAGSRGRGALERRFLGSVSFALVGLSSVNVLVARRVRPQGEPLCPRGPVPLRRALVATDLSETGNRAIDVALGLLPDGGQLTLFHVVPSVLAPHTRRVPVVHTTGAEERRMSRALAEAELEKLVPSHGRALETVVEVVESPDPAGAILQAAERHGADVVILGTHGHGPVAAVLLGSVARVVARKSTRPVLLVPHVGSETS